MGSPALPRPSPRDRGRAAEREAVRWLRSRGLRVVQQNHRNRAGEIDIVARDEDTLCFVEVRSRSRSDYGGAAATVDRRKRERLRRAASLYLALEPWSGPCRFDVVALDRTPNGWAVQHYENAF